MAVAQALVDDRITAHLTADGVRRVLESLWPVDCQICGRPLGSAAPALVVDDAITSVFASLTHPRCRASRWNDDGALRMSGEATLSHSVNCFLMSVSTSSGPRVCPFMAINPGLEMVFLKRSEDDWWGIEMPWGFTNAGMEPPSKGFYMDKPVPGAKASISGDTLMLTLNAWPVTYRAEITAQMRGQICADQGVMVVATHAINPAEVAKPQDLVPALEGDRSVLGWVRLV